MPVYRVDASKMKALVPHKLNSTAVELFDEDIINIRVLGKELLEAMKASSSLSKKIPSEETYAFYNVSIRDTDVVMQDVEVNGVKKSVARYNSQMQVVCTDRCAFSSGTCNVLSIKGMAGEQLKRLPDQSILEGKTSPVISFKKEDGKVSAVATSYADFKAEWDKARELDIAENDFQFGIPLTGMEKLLKLVSTVPDSYVELTVGKRYVYAFLTGLQCIYMCPQAPIRKAAFSKMYRDNVAAFVKKDCNVTVDSKDISNAIRIMNLYEKDALKGQMPFELVVTDKGIEVKRNEARAMLDAGSSKTDIDLVEYGINGSYLACVVSALPAGNIQFGYGMERPVFLFTKGGETPNPYGTGMVVCGIMDVAVAKQQVTEAYQKSLEKKKEKESKK